LPGHHIHNMTPADPQNCMKFLPPRLPSRLITTTTPPRLLPKMSRQYSDSNKASTRDRGRRERNDSPTVVLSKSLSWLLRHGLDQSGLHIRNDGYVRLDELVTPL
jgi:RNA:NAD 2'-phosphotransferase (TPT1/KptA family)